MSARTKMASGRGSGFMSLNTEILLLSALGIGTTLMETAVFSVKENLLKVWELDLAQFQLSSGHQHLLKSVIYSIVIIRGLTAHLYLASYLLLLYPVIMERLRVMMLFWLALSGIRSLVVNCVALVAGCTLCASHSALAPTCFEFIAAKAAELACSAYMWVSVNDLYHQLKRHSSRARPIEVTPEGVEEDQWSELSTSESEEWSLPQSFLAELKVREVGEETSEGVEVMTSRSVDSVLAQAMVDWFCKKVLQLKEKGELPGSKRPDMDSEKYKSLQSRVRKSIATIEPEAVNKGAAIRWLVQRSKKTEERDGKAAEDVVSVWNSQEHFEEPTRRICRRRMPLSSSAACRAAAAENALKDLLGIRPTCSDDWPSHGSVLLGGGSDSKLLTKMYRDSDFAASTSTVDSAMQDVLNKLVTVLCQPSSVATLDIKSEPSLHNMHGEPSSRVSAVIWHEMRPEAPSSPVEQTTPIEIPSSPAEQTTPIEVPSTSSSPRIPCTPNSTPTSISAASLDPRTVDASVQTLPPSGALLRKLDYATTSFNNQ